MYEDLIKKLLEISTKNSISLYKRDVCKRAADAIEKLQAELRSRYTSHDVAEIIAELFGGPCACNFNNIDEWLPEKCELQNTCPETVGVACWEQYLKWRSVKEDAE